MSFAPVAEIFWRRTYLMRLKVPVINELNLLTVLTVLIVTPVSPPLAAVVLVTLVRSCL